MAFRESILTATLVVVFVSQFAAYGDADEFLTVSERVISPQLKNSLAKAARMVPDDVYRELQPHMSQFPLVEAAVPGKKIRWTRLKLNTAGAGADAFRFKANYRRSTDLSWAFIPPSNMRGWMLFPVKPIASFTGFRRFTYMDGVAELDGHKLPDTNNRLYFQNLLDAQIKPKREYLIYFFFTSQEAGDLYAAIRLTDNYDKRTGTVFYSESAGSISSRMGINWPFRFQTRGFQFVPPTPGEAAGSAELQVRPTDRVAEPARGEN